MRRGPKHVRLTEFLKGIGKHKNGDKTVWSDNDLMFSCFCFSFDKQRENMKMVKRSMKNRF